MVHTSSRISAYFPRLEASWWLAVDFCLSLSLIIWYLIWLISFRVLFQTFLFSVFTTLPGAVVTLNVYKCNEILLPIDNCELQSLTQVAVHFSSFSVTVRRVMNLLACMRFGLQLRGRFGYIHSRMGSNWALQWNIISKNSSFSICTIRAKSHW